MPTFASILQVHSSAWRLGAQGVAALLLLSCGGGGSSSSTPPPPPPPPSNTFYVGGNSGGGGYGDPGGPLLSFTPANLTVAAGTTVTWVWQSSGHSLDSGAGCSKDDRFSSNGLQNAGFTLTHTFNTPGTYPFFCGVHCGSNMKGTVMVQ